MAVADDFRNWCGNEKFAKFVRTLQMTSREKGRLTYAQEQTWNEFIAATGASVPCKLESITAALVEALQISHKLELTIADAPGARSQFPGILKDKLLQWASDRKAAGLDLDASLVVFCRHDDVGEVRQAIHDVFYQDNDLNKVFLGATISGSVSSPPPDEGTATLIFMVGDSASEPLSLGWSIQRRGEQPPRWWQFWRR